MNKTSFLSILALFILGSSFLQVHAQNPTVSEDPAHNELRALRDGLLAAMNSGDIDTQIKFLHPNVVVTFQNAEIARGREGVKAYYNKMTSGSNKIVESFHVSVNVDELTILYGGDTGISFGSSVESFKLTSGLNFDLKGRWTITLVKENGQWLIASLHASTNLFDNPLLNLAKRSAYWIGGVCLLVGIVVGWWVGRKRKSAM
jgi:ketosteroid isomerase-like protein